MRVSFCRVALALVVGSFPGLACDCGPSGPACAYATRAAAVFVGTVAFSDHDPALGLRQRTLVKFNVEEAFKGLPSKVRELWIDPGSFTSCYAEYSVGERLLVFAYGGGRTMPPDTSVMSIISGQVKGKSLPAGFNREKPPVVFSAPECSGTRLMRTEDHRNLKSDIEYLRQYKAGTATPSIRGRVTEDAHFGIFGFDPLPGLRDVTITVVGDGIQRSVKTDEYGYYVLPNMLVGRYMVKPSLPPYVTTWGPRDVEVPPRGCGSADFDMIAPGLIEGSVLDSTAKPAANIRVEVLRLGSNGKPIYYAHKETMTDRDGRYRLNELPSGNFQVGINLFRPPDPKTPYIPTKWSLDNGSSSIHLMPGEHKQISAIRLPPPSGIHKIEVDVHWPDGRPANGVTIWGEVGDHAATSGETDANGRAQLDVLERVAYRVEAKIWVGTGAGREVARSGATDLIPGREPIHLKLVLSRRTKEYR